MIASIYELLPGAVFSTETSFVFPHSLLVAIGASGALLSLPFVAFELLHASIFPSRGNLVPMLGALSIIPIAITGLIHIEVPISFIGLVWFVVGITLFQPDSRSHVAGSNPAHQVTLQRAKFSIGRAAGGITWIHSRIR